MATNTFAPSSSASARAAFAAAAGSVISMVPSAPGATSVGASGLVTPMMATLTPPTFSMTNGATPVRLSSTLARFADT